MLRNEFQQARFIHGTHEVEIHPAKMRIRQKLLDEVLFLIGRMQVQTEIKSYPAFQPGFFLGSLYPVYITSSLGKEKKSHGRS
jgi:hypothetical protein